jgi:hypothetical protein
VFTTRRISCKLTLLFTSRLLTFNWTGTPSLHSLPYRAQPNCHSLTDSAKSKDLRTGDLPPSSSIWRQASLDSTTRVFFNSLPIVDKKLIGRKFWENFWFLLGFVNVIIFFLSYKSLENGTVEGSD